MNEIFSEKWLTPVIALVRKGNCGEANALAEFYPNTPSRQLAQVAIDINRQEYLQAAERALRINNLKELGLKDFADLAAFKGLSNLQSATEWAHEHGMLEFGYLCLEARRTLPLNLDQSLGTSFLRLAAISHSKCQHMMCDVALARVFELSGGNYGRHITMLSLEQQCSLLDAILSRGKQLPLADCANIVRQLLVTDLSLPASKLKEIWSCSSSLPNALRYVVHCGLVRQRLWELRKCQLTLDATEKLIKHIIANLMAPSEYAALISDFKREIITTTNLLEVLTEEPNTPQKSGQLRGALIQLARMVQRFSPYHMGLADCLDDLVDTSHYRSPEDFEHWEPVTFKMLPDQNIDDNDLLWPDPNDLLEWFTENKALVHTLSAASLDEPSMRVLYNALNNLNRAVIQKRQEQVLQITELQEAVESESTDPAAIFEHEGELLEKHKTFSLWVRDFETHLANARKASDSLEKLALLLIPGYGDSRMLRAACAGRRSFPHPSKAPKKKETQTITRFTRIEFPEICRANEKTELIIQLTKDACKLSRATKKLQMTAKSGVKNVDVTVFVTAPGFAIHSNRQTLRVPIEKDSGEIKFHLYSVEPGDQSIELEFFQGRKRIGHVLIRTLVDASEGGVRREIPSWIEEYLKEIESKPERREELQAYLEMLGIDSETRALVRFRLSQLETDQILFLKEPTIDELPTRQANRMLHVTWNERDNKLLFALSDDTAAENSWESSAPKLKSDIENYLRELNAFLTEAVSEGNPSVETWESIRLNMQGIGRRLFDNIIPVKLQEIAAKFKTGEILAISTNEQWVPWELMFDGVDFWGLKFTVTRYPRSNNYKRFPDGVVEHNEGRFIRKIVNVVGGEVPETEAEQAAALFKSIGIKAEVKTLRERSVAELSKSLPKADVLHLTCHGYLSPHYLRIAADETRIKNLLPETVQQLPLEKGCLVFANTCSSAAAVVLFGTFNSFGWEFYLRGADVFVGTLGTIPAKYAVPFAASIYRDLVNGAGKLTIGEALVNAKLKAQKDKNIFWLLYCVYGDPEFVMRV